MITTSTQSVSLNHPGGFCETFPSADAAEIALKNSAAEYEGDYSLRFKEETDGGDGWESKSFSYDNWQRIETFAGKIVGPIGSILP